MSASFSILASRAVVSLAGDDVIGFLQTIVTANVTGLADGGAVYSGLLTPQGKILFDFFIVHGGDRLLVDCHGATRDALVQRLTMYKLRRDITVASEDDLAVAVAWGAAPGAIDDVAAYVDPRLDRLGGRYVGPAGAFAPHATADEPAYRAHLFETGVADSPEIGSGELFPHEANFDQLGAVDFSKGCYVGQEVVSRIQHRGTARARIVPVSGEAPLPAPGSDCLAGGRRVGRLLGCEGTRGVALVRIDRIADGSSLDCAGAALDWYRPDWARWQVPDDKQDQA